MATTLADTARLYGEQIEAASQITVTQLARANGLVSQYSTTLKAEQRDVMVAAVVQALATNFLALRTKS